MIVSEYIKVLQQYLADNDDHEVVDTYGESVGEPEESEGECCICDKA